MADDADPLNTGEPTDADTDAILDTLDLLPPASADAGNPGHDLARAAARRLQAVRLRMEGRTYDEVAHECGYANRSAARQAVIRSLTRVEAESVGELRALENARLDADEAILRKIIGDEAKGTGDRIRAIDSRLRLSARRARLNGMDAPLQVALSAGVQADLADALNEMESVLGEVLSVTDERLEG